jgi:protocatechuate 3,4-dioxygenase beta subunit
VRYVNERAGRWCRSARQTTSKVRKRMPIADVVDSNPPYLAPKYKITVLRAPMEDLVAPHERQPAGPDYSRIPVPPGANDLTRQHDDQPIGQRIILFGRVRDAAGNGIPNSLVEIWQANGAGRYADPADPGFFPLDPNFTGAGRCITKEDGSYQFITIRPAAYPGVRGGLYRPAHIHISVFGPHLEDRLITQCYFPDDPLLDRDPIVQAVPDRRGLERLIGIFRNEMVEPNDQDSALAYEYDIVVRTASD